MSTTATLTKRFKITVPKSVREAQNLEDGQEFVFILKGAGVLMLPVPALEQIAGIAEGARSTDIRERENRY